MLHRHGDLRTIGAKCPEVDDLGAVSVDDPHGVAGVDANGAGVASGDGEWVLVMGTM